MGSLDAEVISGLVTAMTNFMGEMMGEERA